MLTRYLSVIILLLMSFISNAQIPTSVVRDAIEKTKQLKKPVGENIVDEESQVYLKYEELEKLKSPQATMRTFMAAMDEVKKGSSGGRTYFNQAVRTINLSHVEENVREMTGRLAAERLVNTLDRITKIDFTHIPDNPNGQKWYFRKQTLREGDQSIEAEIAIEKNADGAWRFTPETVDSLGALYNSVAHLKVVDGVIEYKNWKTRLKAYMPAWTADEFLMFTKGQWLGFLFIFVVALTALSLVRFLTTLYIHDLVKKESLNFKEKDHYKSTLPFGLLAFSLVCTGGTRLLELDLESYDRLTRAFYILIALTSVWSALKIVDLITLHFTKIAKDTANKFDDVLVPMLSKTSKVLVISFGTILVAHSLTFDIGSILAGLGIGGVAVALAAKDTISNLFGSVTVIMDRPFLIGDYVLLDKNLEGTVEEVGFRSTRLRTPQQSVVSLPNNVLANMAIDNYGMRGTRRFKTFLQMDYNNPVEKLEEFCSRVRYLCKIHPLIEGTNAQVYINDMTDKSINILVNIFFRTQDGNIELDERHKFIVEILKLATEVGVSFAYPSSTMVLKSDELQNVQDARNVSEKIL
ncbi:MAG: mechanosensitive ion channel family protein [Bdellovibrionales bacterium]|nr:mechanosensitive ion channel family protein [Bdellovibrionales bacterium]